MDQPTGLVSTGSILAAAMVLLMALCVANSTVAADWVPGSAVITLVALAAAVVMGVLAVLKPVPWQAALALGLLAAPLAAGLAAGRQLAAAHPNDPAQLLPLLTVWMRRVGDGRAFLEPPFVLALLAALFWVAGGWLSWCVLRWRQPLVGVLPGAAVLATNVLNYPDHQGGYVFMFVAVLFALLLWTTYSRSLDSALRRAVRLSGDVRWDFWEAGVIVSVAVLVLGILLPPLSSTDRTVDFQNGLFRGWADIQARLNHQVATGGGGGGASVVSYAEAVKLGGPLTQSINPVFTYTLDGDVQGPHYFRGVDLRVTADGGWTFGGGTSLGVVPGFSVSIVPGASVPWLEDYQALQQGSVRVQMLKPPSADPSVVLYPGQFRQVDISTRADIVVPPPTPPTSPGTCAPATPCVRPMPGIASVERLLSARGLPGRYTVTVAGSDATEDQLRGAGTEYPLWIDPYRNFVGTYGAPPGLWRTGLSPYRQPEDMQRIRQLALQVTAGKLNPYDQAQAIESYLRANYKYTLKPKMPADHRDLLTYFLFDSRQGYCQYFATAMGDMLRTLGIPVRLVNGFGPGTYDEKLGRYLVREMDAHTWVEVYFPHLGWIPFEPTPDGVYNPIPRGSTSTSCGAGGCGGPSSAGQDTGQTPRPAAPRDAGVPTGGGGGGRPQPFNWQLPLAALAVLLSVVFVAGSRWLRPSTVGGAWKRARVLARLAGVPERAGETPLEFGRRLAAELPEAAGPARELAAHFTVAAYAPAELAGGVREQALDAWRKLRPHLLRGVSRRRRS